MKPRAKKKTIILPESNEPLDRIRLVQKLLLEKKCEDVLALDLRTVNSYLSFFIIASAKTETQARAVAKEIDKILKSKSTIPRNSPTQLGKNESGWILLDYGEIVVHLMSPDARQFYSLDRLWGDAKPLNLN